MAGLSSRFAKAGFKKPKYMLDTGGQTLFSRAVDGFMGVLKSEPCLFVCLDVHNTEEFIRGECEELGLSNYEILSLKTPTAGQAETVAFGLQSIDCVTDQSITIFNIDTFRPGFQYPNTFNLDRIDGYLEVFEGEGNHWSFVEPDARRSDEGRVIRVTEKERISNLCSTGLYYFRKSEMFMNSYKDILNTPIKHLSGGERYVAPLYNSLIKAGADIRFNKINREEVIFCGTPDEYYTYMRDQGFQVTDEHKG
jgi:hypothetical protein